MSTKQTRSTSQSGTGLDENGIEQLIIKVCQKFLSKLDEKLDKRFDKMESKINEVTAKIVELKDCIKTNEKEINLLHDKCDEFEIFKRKNSLRFNGIKEEENENLLSIFTNLVNNTMKVKCTISDISNIYRLGKTNIQGKPRTIIIEFVSYLKRNEIIKSKGTLKQTGIFVNENLINKRYNLLMKAKNKYGKNEVWSRNGDIFMKQNDGIKKIICEADI